MRVLVTGSSGPIGAALLPSLRDKGIEVVRASRRVAAPIAGEQVIPWDPMQPLAPETVSGMDAVIHLAGESIVGRWDAAKKQAIRESRVASMTNVVRAMAAAAIKPRVLIGASAVGYYGDRGNEVLREGSPPGAGFLSEVCVNYEAAARPATVAGIRTVLLRIGMVLSPKGGALEKMLPPFKLGVGGRLGSGKQWMSWVDVEDVVGAIEHAIATESLVGPANAVAPNPITNAVFTRTLASVLHRPGLLPAPAFALRLAMGEMADALLLASERVVPDRLMSSGYSFRFPEIRGSLERLLKK